MVEKGKSLPIRNFAIFRAIPLYQNNLALEEKVTSNVDPQERLFYANGR